MARVRLFSPVAFAAAVVACAAVGRPAWGFTEADVARGRDLFPRCALCHVVNDFPRPSSVVMTRGMTGKEAQQRLQMAAQVQAASENRMDGSRDFRTASDLADYIRYRMPQNQPGTLSEQETFALVAFVLQSNGVAANGQAATRDSLKQLFLPDEFGGGNNWKWALVGAACLLGILLYRWRLRKRERD
jgi:hypothetical protein